MRPSLKLIPVCIALALTALQAGLLHAQAPTAQPRAAASAPAVGGFMSFSPTFNGGVPAPSTGAGQSRTPGKLIVGTDDVRIAPAAQPAGAASGPAAAPTAGRGAYTTGSAAGGVWKMGDPGADDLITGTSVRSHVK
jgi:hypothetical protein